MAPGCRRRIYAFLVACIGYALNLCKETIIFALTQIFSTLSFLFSPLARGFGTRMCGIGTPFPAHWPAQCTEKARRKSLLLPTKKPFSTDEKGFYNQRKRLFRRINPAGRAAQAGRLAFFLNGLSGSISLRRACHNGICFSWRRTGMSYSRKSNRNRMTA